MARFLYVVFTVPHAGEDEAYNEWYDNQHVPDCLAVDGITTATRYALAPMDPPQSKLPPYLCLYEVEADDISDIPAALDRAKAEGKMPISEALDRSRTVSSFYVQT